MKHETMSSLLDYVNELHSDKIMIDYHGVTHFHARSYRRTVKYAKAIAARFLHDGLYGKKILIFSGNSYNTILADLSIMAYVGISVPVDPDLTAEEIKNIIDKLQPGALLYSDQTSDKAMSVMKSCPQLRYYSAESDIKQMISDGNSMLTENGSVENMFPKTSADTCKILCTIGHGNHTKAVPVSMDNLLATYDDVIKRFDFKPGAKIYIATSLCQSYGGIALLFSMLSGLRISFSSDGYDIISDLRALSPETLVAVPSVLKMIHSAVPFRTMEKYRKKSLPSLLPNHSRFKAFYELFGGSVRRVISSAARLDVGLKLEYEQLGLRVIECYGMIETSGSICMDVAFDNELDCSGVVLDGIDLQIENPDERGYGEILVKGDCVVKGYYKGLESDLTFFDELGYFHTGDLGMLDNQKRLKVIGRISDIVITSSGKRIDLQGIVSTLKECKGITDAEVFCIDDRIHAKVKSKHTGSIVMQAIEIANSRLPDYSQIVNFELIHEH